MYKIENVPEEIEVFFEYDNKVKTPYYAVDIKEVGMMQRVHISEIHSICQDAPELVNTVSYWTPTQHGWTCQWHITPEEFMKRAVLKQIKAPIHRIAEDVLLGTTI